MFAAMSNDLWHGSLPTSVKIVRSSSRTLVEVLIDDQRALLEHHNEIIITWFKPTYFLLCPVSVILGHNNQSRELKRLPPISHVFLVCKSFQV